MHRAAGYRGLYGHIKCTDLLESLQQGATRGQALQKPRLQLGLYEQPEAVKTPIPIGQEPVHKHCGRSFDVKRGGVCGIPLDRRMTLALVQAAVEARQER